MALFGLLTMFFRDKMEKIKKVLIVEVCMKFKEDSFLFSVAEAWKRTMRDNSDGLAKSRRSLFFSQLCQTLYSNMSGTAAGTVFNTALLLLLFADATAEQYGYFIAQASAMVGLFGLAQFIAPFIVERLKKRRAYVYTLTIAAAVLNIVGLPLVVVAPMDVVAKGYLYVAISAMQTLLSSLTANAYSVWTLHSLPDTVRSDYYTIFNLANSAISYGLNILLAMYMDYFQAHSMAFLGIVMMRGAAIGFVVADYLLRGRIAEPEYNKGKARIRFVDILKAPFQSKRYLITILYSCLMNFSMGFAGVYYATYLIDGAKLTYTYITLMGLLSLPLNLISIAVWGRLIRKKGWTSAMPPAIFLFSLAYLINGFVTDLTPWMYGVSIVFCNAVSGGYTLSEHNIPFLYLPDSLRDSCLMFRGLCITIASFLAASAANVFYKYTIGRDLTLFGMTLENRAYMSTMGFMMMQLPILILLLIAFREKRRQKALV